MSLAYPRVLFVDTTYASQMPKKTEHWENTINYDVYHSLPGWPRRTEKLLRLDFGLALQAVRMAKQYDVIYAGSEKVGLPLCMLGLKIPLVTLVHHMSPEKLRIGRLWDIGRKWVRIGYNVTYDKEILHSYFKIPYDHFFRFLDAPLDRYRPNGVNAHGSILSMGVAKRDYAVLLAALEGLPGCEMRIFATSRYLDRFHGKNLPKVPWVQIFNRYISSDEVTMEYQSARFIIITIVPGNTQYSAGATTALDALANGKAIIANDTPGLRDFVIDGSNGILVPPGDSSSLRSAIRYLWDNPDVAFQMGMKGRQLAEQNFDPANSQAAIRQAFLGAYLDSQGAGATPARG
jgi:hypothetical protein